MSPNYPELYQHLGGLMAGMTKEMSGTMGGFSKLHHEAVADGTLSTKTKELIALGIAIAVRCDGCIAFHVHDAMKAGATRAEIMETIGVAILMGGGPAMVYGAQASEAISQFEAAGAG